MDMNGKKPMFNQRYYQQGDCHYYTSDNQFMQNTSVLPGNQSSTTTAPTIPSSSLNAGTIDDRGVSKILSGANDNQINNISQIPAASKLTMYLNHNNSSNNNNNNNNINNNISNNNHDLNRQLSGLNLETVNNRKKVTTNIGGPLTNNPNFNVPNGYLSNTHQQVNQHHINQSHLSQQHSNHHIQQQPHQMVQSTNSTMASNQYNVQPTPFQSTYFLSDDIKFELIKKQSIMLNEPQLNDLMIDLPEIVDVYHELYPLETSLSSSSSAIGLLVTSTYRATHMKTGEIVCLRRIHSFPLNAMSKSFVQTIETWKKVSHANIVQLRQVFSTKAFGDSSLVFVYDYYPGAQTMLSQCFTNQNNSNSNGTPTSVNGISGTARPYSHQTNQRSKLVAEHMLWAYIIQISSALRTLHANGLACRSVDLTKILITSGFNIDLYNNQHSNPHLRIRFSSPGLVDIVFHEAFIAETQMQNLNPKLLIAHYQEEDLVNFGKICLAIISNSLQVLKRGENLMQSLEILNRSYSNDLRSLIMYLISPKNSQQQQKSINDIMPMIGARFYAQLDLTYSRLDSLENELTKQLDNERLFRLLCKLGSINERSINDLQLRVSLDTQWSETGDRYLLKLFRDYLFHQVTQDGQPWLDIAHIVSTLNKLDCGSPEKICLYSRDNHNLLIVSFAELRRYLNIAFNELSNQ